MGILKKKLKATTLMETLVATSIIIIVFVIASLILNNTFRNIMKRDAFAVENRSNQLHYFYINNRLEIPYSESFEKYEVSIEQEEIDKVSYLKITIQDSMSQKASIKYILDEN